MTYFYLLTLINPVNILLNVTSEQSFNKDHRPSQNYLAIAQIQLQALLQHQKWYPCLYLENN